MVEYIKWKDKDWPVKLAGIAFFEYSSKTGKSILGQAIDPEEHAKLLWIGIKVAHKLLKEDFYNEDGTPIISEEDCYWMIDDCPSEYIKVYQNSLAKLDGKEDKTDKKKSKK